MIAHDVLTYMCARSVGIGEEEILIRPYIYKDTETIPIRRDYELENREGGVPVVASDDPKYEESEYYSDFIKYSNPKNEKVPLIQVLSLYSAEPDWGMDSGLKLSPVQALTGGSQGYRHLRYGLFFFRAGVVHRMALHYFDLARIAFNRSDTYWGVRFSARAIHYIEDLLTPVHTKPFTEMFFFKKILHAKDLYFITYNYHLNFERFVTYHLWHGNGIYTGIIESAVPFESLDLKKDLLRGSRIARKHFSLIFKECKNIWGETMNDRFVKISIEDINRFQPTDGFLESILIWLEFSASFIKSYIEKFVKPYIGN
jgi:hypothetical protein